MASKVFAIERPELPVALLEWLEADAQKGSIILFHEENGQIILERLENVDPGMLARVRANMERYRPALERLADS